MKDLNTCDGISLEVSFDGITVNGLSLSAPFLPSRFDEVIGLSPRIYKGSVPAPAGHRNNWRYLYDGIGVRLTDQHDTGCVDEIEIYTKVPSRPKEFQPRSPFIGILTVLGVSVDDGASVLTVLAGSSFPFEQRLPGEWSCKRNGVFIDLIVSSTASEHFRESTACLMSIAVNLRGRGKPET